MVHKMYKALIIEESSIIRNFYKNALAKLSIVHKMNFSEMKEASNCDGAYTMIQKYGERSDTPDIVFLGIKLTPSVSKKMLSGEDIAMQIRACMPHSKIIVSTAFDNYYRIYNILKNINPASLLIKNDLTSEELITAVYKVLTQPPYYSNPILKLVKKEATRSIVVDALDRRLLYELSIYTQTKDLPNMLHLSLAAIEKRKRRLKEIFEVKSTHDLILKAREDGFI